MIGHLVAENFVLREQKANPNHRMACLAVINDQRPGLAVVASQSQTVGCKNSAECKSRHSKDLGTVKISP